MLATIVLRDLQPPGETNTFDLPQGKDIKTALRDWFDQQHAEVLGTIPELGDPLPERMPDLTDWSDRMGDSFTPMIGAYWEKSARATYERVGTDPDRWEVVSPHLQPEIRKLSLNFCRSTNATTTKALGTALANLRDDLTAGLVEEGESIPELTRRVQGLFETMSKSKATQIAATEASRALHGGQNAAAIDSDVVAGFELLLSSDACPLCRKIHDDCKAVPLGRSFAVIGDNPDYSHIAYPPLHPSCQCTIIEVLKPDVGGPEDPQWGETLDNPEPDEEPTRPAPAPKPEPKPKKTPKPKPKAEPESEPSADKPQPTGTPVGNALDVKVKGEAGTKITEAITTIDSVHGDGTLPKIPVEKTELREFAGFFERRGNNAERIAINPKGDHPQLTMAHEVGHFLEKIALPGTKDLKGDRMWHLDTVTAEWQKAVEASEGVTKLKALRGKYITVDMGDGKTRKVKADPKHLDYLLKYDEIWARAYAQYIGTRSESESMADEFHEAFVKRRPRVPNYREQWNAVDFRPIADAMDAIFQKQGWRT